MAYVEKYLNNIFKKMVEILQCDIFSCTIYCFKELTTFMKSDKLKFENTFGNCKRNRPAAFPERLYYSVTSRGKL